MPTPEKKTLVAQLREDIQSNSSLYLTEFSGLNVETMNELRSQIRAAHGRLQVAKNRLLKLAIAGTAAEGLNEYLTGPTAIAFCGEAPIAVAKVISDFGRDHEYLAIKAGLVEGRVVDRQQSERMASLPPRQQLLSELLAGLISPAAGLLRVLAAATTDLVRALEAIADKRQQTEGEQ